MPSGLRLRFWLESVLGSITGILAIVTLFWHDWIETVFGADPDKGNGCHIHALRPGTGGAGVTGVRFRARGAGAAATS